MNDINKSEIRNSTIRELLDKVRRSNYHKYLISIRLEQIRSFQSAQINFDFPVTALVGPNGAGKSTVLGAAACAYDASTPRSFFHKSRVGDESMNNWSIDYEIIDKDLSPKSILHSSLLFYDNMWMRRAGEGQWDWISGFNRTIKFFNIYRTVPATESPLFMRKKMQDANVSISTREVEDFNTVRTEAERILGKSLADFKLLEITLTKTKYKPKKKKGKQRFLMRRPPRPYGFESEQTEGEAVQTEWKQYLYLGSDGKNEYSEFNFGSGESSIIRTVADIESLPPHALVLIDELENGLHPVAVRRLVEYLVNVAKRKNIQVVFTTHSDYALIPLPPEAIWSCLDGKVQQGKLSVEVLKSVTGRIDKRLAIYVEDEFSKFWVEAVLREILNEHLDEIGVYAVSGDGNAIKVHLGHISNPAISFNSLCFIDGDSKQKDDPSIGIFRLPGATPESTIFNSVINNLENNIALLTVACQRSFDKQMFVANEIKRVSHTNRDPHLLFNQVGLAIGFVPETVIRGAFMTVWIQENPQEAENIVEPIKKTLELSS